MSQQRNTRYDRAALDALERAGITYKGDLRWGEHRMIRVEKDGVEVDMPLSGSPRHDVTSHGRVVVQHARRLIRAKQQGKQ